MGQWSPSPFEFEGMHFNCAEQFMMFCKAVLFEDFEMADAIMASVDPAEQQKLGRKVKRFDVVPWSQVARDFVYVGNHCKFTQSTKHHEAIMKTVGTTLVEASPYDRIWGIGRGRKDPLALDRKTWDGKNWLGETLTKVREDLLKDAKDVSAFNLARNIVEKYQSNK